MKITLLRHTIKKFCLSIKFICHAFKKAKTKKWKKNLNLPQTVHQCTESDHLYHFKITF